MYKYPVVTTSQNESCLLRWLKPRLGKDVISAGPKYDFLPHPTTPHPPTMKATPKSKNWQNNGFCFPPPPPHRFSTQSSQYQNWKANKYSILTVNELGPLVLESTARISKFYAPINSEHKFNKTEIENWLPLGYNLRSSWLGIYSHNRYTLFIR